jgi:hypothetical protein
VFILAPFDTINFGGDRMSSKNLHDVSQVVTHLNQQRWHVRTGQRFLIASKKDHSDIRGKIVGNRVVSWQVMEDNSKTWADTLQNAIELSTKI